MLEYRASWIRAAVTVAVLAVGASEGVAQDDPPLGWTDVAEFTFVMTSGNASASTLGLKNTLEHRWDDALFHLSAGAVRAESGITMRTATGTIDDFSITKITDTEKTAENYFIQSRFDRGLTETAYLFGGLGWDRNTFAGVQNRYDVVAGAGRAWVDSEARRFKSDLGLTYTVQDDVIEDPSREDSFGGLRVTLDFFESLTATTDFASLLVVDENLSETDDLRADWTNSVTVAMSENLALKASLQILYDNLPAFVAVPLGAEQVLGSLQKADRTVTLALVIDF
jgi:putative salt-induced outer membrane protein YdiY